ncbi:hypothetical protein L3X38_041562 [Prunus dulcis]|uniref:DUF7788 domain-containing protein n=1 Tax=Prunus dulcis TaxID=3755 RepID=A0AAD4UTA1_PRUDU|nr:hypothetical protein L3X38_041562 [Prunus dulcis]
MGIRTRELAVSLGLLVSELSEETAWKGKSEFKEQGYGDNAVPHILLWNIGYWNKLCIEEHHPGVTLLSGFSENLLKSFLDNGGEIGRCHLMEAAIADKEDQALSVVD